MLRLLSELTTAVVSVTRTARGRYFWAAWWTAAPCYSPFRKPDAQNGGAASREAALADAARVCGRHLSPTSSYWAHSVNRMLRGERPRPPRAPKLGPKPERARSAEEVLGVEKGASLIEIKRAHRARVFATHPDRGGDAEEFREAQRAYERLLAKHGKKK